MDPDTERPAAQSWGQRNAMTIILVVMLVMFALVIIIQVTSR
jgi:hypothetical protein